VNDEDRSIKGDTWLIGSLVVVKERVKGVSGDEGGADLLLSDVVSVGTLLSSIVNTDHTTNNVVCLYNSFINIYLQFLQHAKPSLDLLVAQEEHHTPRTFSQPVRNEPFVQCTWTFLFHNATETVKHSTIRTTQ
jgi:hypothetical protein